MGLSNTAGTTIARYDAPSWLVTAVGVSFALFGIVHAFTHPEPVLLWLLEIALVSVPAALIVYGGYWMATQELTRTDRWNLVTWCLIGGLVAGSLAVGYVVVERTGSATVIEPAELVLFGALGGVFVSLYASISNERRHLQTDVGSVDTALTSVLEREPLSADARTLAELALDSRSWNTLRLLSMAEAPLGVETLAARIAAVEDANPKDVYVDLVHARLPRLADMRLVHHDDDIESVRLTEEVTRLESAGEELAGAGRTLSRGGER